MDVVREAASAADVAREEKAPLSFMGPVRLIPGEDASSYAELLARMAGALKPADIIEEVWVRDLVDVVWETLRLRRLRASLFAACAQEGMCKLLGAVDADTPYRTSHAWAARDPAAVEEAEAALTRAGMSMDTVMASTLAKTMREVMCIDRMTIAAQKRHDAILREIDRRRAGLAQRRCGVESEAATARPVIENAPALAPV